MPRFTTKEEDFKVVRLSLSEHAEGVDVSLELADGRQWYVLGFDNATGRVTRYCNVCKSTGLALDSCGRVMLEFAETEETEEPKECYSDRPSPDRR